MAETRFWVRVQPGAMGDELAGYSGGVLRVKVAAPPVEGRANKALIDYLARLLKVRRGQITILKWTKSRNKLVGVEGWGLAN